MPDTDLRQQKQQLRRELRALRPELARQCPDAAERLAAHALAGLPPPPPGLVVACYHPLADEMDPLPLARALAGRGCVLALPVVMGRNLPLSFRRYAFGDPVVSGFIHIPQPLPEAPELRPDWLLVPLLGFDRAGGRIGYGGGYYDRTLQALRATGPVLAVGIAYAGQEVALVPVEPQDQRLDAVATEAGLIPVNAGNATDKSKFSEKLIR